jgi:glutamate dehydrogenase
MPFLVDSVASEFSWQGLETHLLIHPMIKIRRTRGGKISEVIEPGMADADARNESVMHIEITHQSGSRLGEIKTRLEQILIDVRASVEDWRPMRERMAQIIDEMHASPKGFHVDEVSETRDFLRWIHDNNFTFLGFREYTAKGRGKTAGLVLDPATGLGIMRDPKLSVFEDWGGGGAQAPEVKAFARHRGILLVTKTNHRSTIHRPVHMDAIGIKRLDEKGNLIGQWLFVGLFTSVAYNRTPSSIPLLRRRLQLTMERSGFSANSHDGKALMNILESYPRDELFQIDDDTLFETAMGILHLQERPRTTLFIRRDELERYCSCLVFVPRERYNTDLRQRIQEILADELNGRIAAFFTQLGESSLARCHIIVPMLKGKIPNYDHAAIEERLFQASRSWADHLGDAITERSGEEQAREVLSRWSNAFDHAYQDRYTPDEVIADIEILEHVISSGEIDFNLYRIKGAPANAVRFKIYQPDGALALSDVLPIFEHLGFKVIDEMGPHPVNLEDIGGGSIIMHNFGLETRDCGAVDLSSIRDNFHATFRRVWRGEIESDSFNALVARSGLTWREVVVIRAYCKYLRQAGIAFSQEYMEQTMSANPGVAKDLVSLFMCRFDPAASKTSGSMASRLRNRIAKALDAIASADEDRILRRYLNLIENPTRTNYFQTTPDGGNKSYLSFKLNSQMIDELPLPKPFREIFVYSPRVEGVHLRFGYIARGGLRWSDRREDFRTEVLGLVKAQQVKNAVIVPVGSKGGFVVKRPPTEGGR